MRSSLRHASLAALFSLALLTTASAALAETREFTRADGVLVRQGAEWVSPPTLPSFRTVDMRQLPAVREWRPGDPLIEIPRRFYGDINAPTPVPTNPVAGHDLLADLQRAFDRAQPAPRNFTVPARSFDGIRSTASPNDPTGDVGTHQFVMSINGDGGSQVAVYDKVTGAQVGNNFTMASLGSGGACAQGSGDPIILFDELAGRWVLTEFTPDGLNALCVYISNTNNLAGQVTWSRYAFTFPGFPDYPKYGVWPDAYYVGANEGGTAGRRPFYAMDRVRMLAGQAATMQRLTVANLAGFGFQLTQPADISGSNVPAVGTPGIFMRHRDDEAHNAGANNPNSDFLEMFQFTVNWTTPASSSITGPISIPIAEYSSNLNGLTAFEAFPQANNQRLDPLREPVMHRLVYRRFATYEALVGNFVTDLFLGAGSAFPNDTGAVRWFELRRNVSSNDLVFRSGFEAVNEIDGGSGPWALHQQGTYAPEDSPGVPANQADRWMGAINIDSAGNIGLAYNVVRQSPAISTGIRYTGRLRDDPLGVMTQGETIAVAGQGNIGDERWGDYNDMGVDPVDGCTFWFLGNYANSTLNPANARANRVVAFRHASCGSSPPPPTEFCRTPNLAITDNNLTGVTDNLVVSGAAGTISNLDVVVDVDHSYVGDLRLRLTRVSDGATINLMSNPTNNPSGDCSGDNVRVTYDDQATVPAQTGCVSGATPTMSGLRIPQAALSAYNGQSLNGTWRLTAIDSAADDTGTLLRWCLRP